MDPPKKRTLQPDDYAIGWLCALSCELAASTAMLDERHDSLPRRPNDHNTYILGSIGQHNIVIAGLPAGVYGTVSAATVATQMLSSFPSIRFGLMVGIGGGVPGGNADIRLGDVVVSKPSGTSGGVVQYDFGKTVKEGTFVRLGSLNQPPLSLLTAISKLEADCMLGVSRITHYLRGMIERYPVMEARFTYPGLSHDRLFDIEYEHEDSGPTCATCDSSRTIDRQPRMVTDPVVHYGTIASGNQVMRNGIMRERLRRELDILCFEMEAAGLMNSYPCLVVRGISDYADSHKSNLWQEYAAATAAAYAKELILSIPPSQVLSSPTAAEVAVDGEATFTVPFSLAGCPRIVKFVGRDAYIRTMESRILPIKDDGEPRVLILHGVGGIGKTQLAIKFAKSYRDKFSAIFWVNGRTEPEMKKGLAAIADRIRSASPSHTGILGEDEASTETAVKISTRWLGLSQNFRWLIIFDNIDSQESTEPDAQPENTAYDIRKYLDLFNHGTIIITTRLSYLSQLGTGVSLDRLSQDEGIGVLTAVNPQIGSGVATDLARRLDGLPLALNHAACYISQKKISADRYLRRYNEELAGRKKLLEHIPRLSSYSASLMTTWEVSLVAIKDENPLAAKLLSLFAFLHNADLRFELFQSSPVPIDDWLYELIQDEDLFQDQIEALSNFSFLQMNEGTNPVSYSMHPVVQDWGRDRLEEDAWKDTLCRGMGIVSAAILKRRLSEPWEIRRRLIWHVDRCMELLDKVPEAEARISALAITFGQLYHDIYRQEDAKRALERALPACISILGRNHKLTLQGMGYLASVYQAQGLLADATLLLQDVLTIIQGEEDCDNSIIFQLGVRLAGICRDTGDYNGAKSILLLAIDNFSESSTAHQQDLATALLSLSIILREQGLLTDAETTLQKTLQTLEESVGPYNIQIYSCLHSLGNVYKNQGRLLDAEEAFQKAISGFSNIFGHDHAVTLEASRSLHEINHPRTTAGLEERIKSFRMALRKHEEAQGSQSLSTLRCALNLGMSLSDNGQFEEADTLLHSAYQRLEDSFGSSHPDSIAALSGLGCLYGKQKRFVESRPFLQRAMTMSEQVFGAKHVRSISYLCNLADLYNDEGRADEAEAAFRRAISLHEEIHGPENVATLAVVQRLGRFYMYNDNGPMVKAERYLSRALDGFRRALGPNHWHTIAAAEELSTVHEIQENETPTEITYVVNCGVYCYKFREQAPRFLCDKSKSQHPGYKKVLDEFVTSTTSRHHGEILQDRSWRCHACGKPAGELVHNTVPLLQPGNGVLPDASPTLLGTAVPICMSAGECDRLAERRVRGFMDSTLPGRFSPGVKTCNSCGIQENVKLCTRCKTIGYCSKECQARDYPSHKRPCRRTK